MSAKVDVVVINLTRLGDLLQSQPLIDDLHLAGYRTGLVCLENFLPATAMLRNLDAVWPLSGATMLASLGKNWHAALEQILGFSRRVTTEGSPGFILNLTPTAASRLLTRLLASSGAQILGFGMDSLGFGLNQGYWAAFLAVAAQKRINAPFNVADMLRGLAFPIGAKPLGSCRLASPSPAAVEWAEKFLHEQSGDRIPAGFVAFQPGASEDKRRWPIEHFRRLGERLWSEARMMPVLLGSAAEKNLGERYDSSKPFINAIGKTDLPQLAALLRRCRLLVTNDTGTMHLAAGQNVPSLAFFLATAQPWDTGPLLPDCCCLEPAIDCHPCAFGHKCDKNFACREKISPEAAGDLALAWLKAGNWNAGLTERVKNTCRVWLTGDCAFSRIAPAAGQHMDERSLWLSWLGVFWRQLIGELDGGNKTASNSGSFLANLELPAPASAPATSKALLEAAELAGTLAGCVELTKTSPRGGQLFLRNCERLQGILAETPHLETLAAFWQELRLNQINSIDNYPPILTALARNFRGFASSLLCSC